MSGHGADAETFEAAVRESTDRPRYIGNAMAFMFETRAVIRPTGTALNLPQLAGGGSLGTIAEIRYGRSKTKWFLNFLPLGSFPWSNSRNVFPSADTVSSSRSTILPSFVQTDFQVVALTNVSVTVSAMG